MFGRHSSVLGLILTLFFLTSIGFADESATSTENEEKWISLFDGKTLGCWESGGEAGCAEPEIKEGCLVLGMGSISSGVRYNEEKAGKPFPKTNYEIEYIAKRQSGNDFFAAMTFPFGDSACSLVNGGWGGTLFGISCVDNMDASENNFSSYYGFKNKTWYIFRIRVTDHVIMAWLDDEEMIKAFTDGHEISTRIEMNRYEPFGIASWITEGWIKSIRYRLLDESEIAELDEEAKQRARKPMKLPL